ncbi:hypothetical protein LZ32DRAFT_322861 [Colletotrichum eremochloae]|nr:hypothetical protein LZ32DRAFT_322861 [Colletotrichum eremochloae]
MGESVSLSRARSPAAPRRLSVSAPDQFEWWCNTGWWCSASKLVVFCGNVCVCVTFKGAPLQCLRAWLGPEVPCCRYGAFVGSKGPNRHGRCLLGIIR